MTVGDFTLGGSLIGLMDAYQPVTLASDAPSKLSGDFTGRFILSNNSFYNGANPASPQVGDISVDFLAIQPGIASVIAMQHVNALGTVYDR